MKICCCCGFAHTKTDADEMQHQSLLHTPFFRNVELRTIAGRNDFYVMTFTEELWKDIKHSRDRFHLHAEFTRAVNAFLQIPILFHGEDTVANNQFFFESFLRNIDAKKFSCCVTF